LVAVWIVERVCSELARVRDFIAPLPPMLGSRPAMAKIAVLAPIYLF
jgi:hypothetical protein